MVNVFCCRCWCPPTPPFVPTNTSVAVPQRCVPSCLLIAIDILQWTDKNVPTGVQDYCSSAPHLVSEPFYE
ncbi:hypothetical protein J6590_098934 [Homalodisca vitripennis]|nr:hypothetical protein J6590_098934 [Homalodisca vitripennis]